MWGQNLRLNEIYRTISPILKKVFGCRDKRVLIQKVYEESKKDKSKNAKLDWPKTKKRWKYLYSYRYNNNTNNKLSL